MPLFSLIENQLTQAEKTSFKVEKDLQRLIEMNLGTVFNCRFVASEFSTGTVHAGRIDTLALSEDGNPVIIEYKNTPSSELITQSLFYLNWIHDHKGDFELAVQKSLGSGIEIDWNDIRVICLAPSYRKYDLHAVKVIGANIELWKYTLFKNGMLYLEDEFQASKSQSLTSDRGKNSGMVEAEKTAAVSAATAIYHFEDHIEGKSPTIQALTQIAREFILGLGPEIEEVPKKFYIAYKVSQNIVCMEPRTKDIKFYVKLKSEEILKPPPSYKDVSNIGHYGTGDSQFQIISESDFEQVKPFIEQAYNKAGG